jgi:hypothetical protein
VVVADEEEGESSVGEVSLDVEVEVESVGSFVSFGRQRHHAGLVDEECCEEIDDRNFKLTDLACEKYANWSPSSRTSHKS